MQITVNGNREDLELGATVGQVIERHALDRQRVAVEVNSQLVPRRTYDCTSLHDGDRVEIVTFVGGG